MDQLFPVKYSWLIPLLPLIGAMISGFLGARWLKQKSHWPIWLSVAASAVLSFMLLAALVANQSHEKPEQAHRTESGAVDSGPARSSADQLKQAFHLSVTRHLYTWIQAGPFKADVAFFLDPLSAVMLCIVTGIGLLITIFAAGYMAGDPGYFRFFAYLGLFIFAMTILVMADNFVLLYLGWEGVGLCSYLLIGYYYEKPSAREAAKKAFLVNRIGDFGFGLGIMLIFLTFGTVSYFGNPANPEQYGALLQAQTNFFHLQPWQRTALDWIPFLLMLGAVGKSAQFPLHVWLPDAMEGPTPVSALIHAATMVTAGVYMIVRCGTLFVGNAPAVLTVAAVGTFTAIFAATIALRQFDLKKVFAYSTISQLGFMFAAAGVLAPVAAIFHLLTHAFFKALLFLSSGVVMHAMAGQLDMRDMSGLKRILPKTNILMLIGCLALAGFPFFSGFLSKDEIIAAAWYQNKFIAILLLVTAFLTAYYTFRLYFRVFQGPLVLPGSSHSEHSPAHDDHAKHHNHEPAVMILPLAILAVGAIVAGFLNWPEKKAVLGPFLGQSPSFQLAHLSAMGRYGNKLSPVPFGAEEVADADVHKAMFRLHINIMAASGLIALLGIYLAYLLHLKYRDRADALALRFPNITRLLERKFWIDEIYQGFIVEPLRRLGRFAFAFDTYVIDSLIWTVGFIPQLSGFTLKLTTQRGSLQGYALLMLLGIAIILLVIFL